MWQRLNQHPEYEIYSEYDDALHCYPIRKIGKTRILKTRIDKGYVRICLEDNVQYRAHRIIAEHFIPNDDPENKIQVDHINHDRTNNRITNLRWVSPLQNTNNKSKYNDREIEYEPNLPDDVIVVNIYGKYRFNGYYFANDVFYKDTGNGNYRIVPWHYIQSENRYKVRLTDENTIQRTINKKPFYKLYSLEN